MSTFAEHIEAAANGEPIEAIVIGEYGWGGWDEDRISRKAPVQRGEVLPWDKARPMLDYSYSCGYGSPECDAICAWTPSYVLWVTQYDGATQVNTAPRHPVAHMPDMPGG